MAALVKTQRALNEASATFVQPFGLHRSEMLDAAADGIIIGSKNYDPFDGDSPLDIDPFDIMGEFITGNPQIPIAKKLNPLDYDVILHRDPKLMSEPLTEKNSTELGLISASRRFIATQISGLLRSARPHSHDLVRGIEVGDPDLPLTKNLPYIEGTNDDNQLVNLIADRSKRKMVFVIGGQRLPYENRKPDDLKNVIAVLAQHRIDVEVPQGNRIYTTGHPDMPVVDASSPRQLARWNNYLDMVHQKKIERLGRAGLTVADVVFDENLNYPHFDMDGLDKKLSLAVKAVAGKNYKRNCNIVD